MFLDSRRTVAEGESTQQNYKCSVYENCCASGDLKVLNLTKESDAGCNFRNSQFCTAISFLKYASSTADFVTKPII